MELVKLKEKAMKTVIYGSCTKLEELGFQDQMELDLSEEEVFSIAFTLFKNGLNVMIKRNGDSVLLTVSTI